MDMQANARDENAHREILRARPGFTVYRAGRFLVAELAGPHRVLSTSVRNGGQSDRIGFLMNHQSCEANAHLERHDVMHANGLDTYHDVACAEAGLAPDAVALMGTAANMRYAGIVEHCDEHLGVTAIVTAGVAGNAACAADPTTWREGAGRFEKTPPYAGTINAMLLLDRPLAAHALAQAAMVVAEAKAGALQRLGVRSRYSPDFATGTTTDQFCIACPREGAPALGSTSTGVRAGELVGRAMRDATLEALRWQNGLEPSYARGLFHALGAYGLTEAYFTANIGAHLDGRGLALLQANLNAVVYDPLVGAPALALASVLDRMRHGALPASAAREALRQQAACLAAGLAAQPERWLEFYRGLGELDPQQPAQIALRAIALGWSAKWN
ncbi:MAG: adenosylcobinamide amidohydrolase [Pseudomonadota bacterium]